MRPERSAPALAVAAAVAAVVAGVAAAAAGEWSAAVAASVAAVVAAGSGAQLWRARAAVRVRPDLAAWLDERAAATGEARDVLADRALARYRDALGDGERLAEPVLGERDDERPD